MHETYYPVPVERTANATSQWVVLACAATAFALLAGYGIREWRRTGSPLVLLAPIGGGIACLLEPMYDLMARIYMYMHGAHLMFTVAGRGMQLWAPFGYGTYIGLCVTLFHRLATDPSATRRRYWRTVGVLLVVNLLIEIPGTRLGLYEYYGPQAFNLTGFPLFWLPVNAVGGIAAAVILARVPALTRGPNALAILLLVPSCFIGGDVFVGWPAFASISLQQSDEPILYVGACLTILIGVGVLRGMAALVVPLEVRHELGDLDHLERDGRAHAVQRADAVEHDLEQLGTAGGGNRD